MAGTIRTFKDQMGNDVDVAFPPTRIISLVPSQTELLADLSLSSEVVGITRFCVHPPAWAGTKPHIGGTKNFQFDLIDQLNPDLIIGNKEENYSEGIQNLQKKYPVWMSDIRTLQDALEMIRAVGRLTDREKRATAIAATIHDTFLTMEKFSGASVLYLIWRKPWMVAGTDTFINGMLHAVGLENVVKTSRYPQLEANEIRGLNPEYIFLSSEPYPFREKHIEELRALCPEAKVLLVDGEIFSWYGTRLLKAPAYFRNFTLS